MQPLLTADSRRTFAYSYNLEGELTAYAGPGGDVEYSYDETHQLTGASGDRTESYAYDANGNRTDSHLHDDDYVTGTNNRLLSDGDFDYTRDDEGNRLTKTNLSNGEVTTYAWDYRNRLIGVTVEDSMENVILEATFTYDVFNNLIIREIDADGDGAGESEILATVYNGNHPWADFSADGELQSRYLYGEAVDQIMVRVDAEGEIDWYQTDNLGSVRQIVDSEGNILNEKDYDSFGNIIAESDPENGDRFAFTAREWEAAVDLYFYRARWYDPSAGRFISEDPIEFAGDPTNLSRYVRNSPLDRTDPKGLDYFDCLAQCIDENEFWKAAAAGTAICAARIPKRIVLPGQASTRTIWTLPIVRNTTGLTVRQGRWLGRVFVVLVIVEGGYDISVEAYCAYHCTGRVQY